MTYCESKNAHLANIEFREPSCVIRIRNGVTKNDIGRSPLGNISSIEQQN